MHSKNTISRRQFVQKLALGTGLSLLPFSPALFAIPNSNLSPLAFRKNAEVLPLHFNENSLGMSLKAVNAAKQAINTYGNRYPDTIVEQLKEMLATLNKVPVEQMILGNGSTEILGAVVYYAASLKATLVEPKPTFGDVNRRASANAMNIVQVDVGKDFSTDIDALKKQAEKINGPVFNQHLQPQ